MRALLLANGGIKATVALDDLLRSDRYTEVVALDIRTGHEPTRQGFASVDVVKWYMDKGAPVHRVLVEVSDVYAWGAYAQFGPTYILPLLTSVAGEVAASLQCNIVAVGAITSGRVPTELFDTLRRIIRHGADGRLQLIAPNEHDTYAKVIHRGMQHSAPLQLTSTCRYDVAAGCGTCVGCKAKIEAINEIKSDANKMTA